MVTLHTTKQLSTLGCCYTFLLAVSFEWPAGACNVNICAVLSTASNILTAWYLLCLCKKVNIAKIKPVMKKGLSISIFWQLLRCEVILQFSRMTLCFAVYIHSIYLHVFCVSIFTWTSICSMVSECTRLNHGTTQSKEMYHVRAVHWLLLAWGSAEQNCSEKFLQCPLLPLQLDRVFMPHCS